MKKYFNFFLLPILALTSSCAPKGGISFLSSGHEHDTYFDDNYFLLDSHYYHQEIALVSLANAMASIHTSEDYAHKADYLIDIWKQEGFQNIFINDEFLNKPTKDSIGFGIASKKIRDFNLVTITIRSGEYESEWASNFNVGPMGNSHGFDYSSVKVLTGLDSYIADYNITGKTKLWINGYSRGGAVSNITAGKILDRINNNTFNEQVKTTVNDIYAYCFEAPSGVYLDEETAHGELYSCIHNLLNVNDVVPLVPPYQWGFTRYGVDHYYPDRLTDIYFNSKERKKLVSNYHFTYGSEDFPEYAVDDWQFYDPGEDVAIENNLPRETLYPSMGRFNRKYVDALQSAMMGREQYSYLVEKYLGNLILTFMGLNPDIGNNPLNLDSILNAASSYAYIRTIFFELRSGRADMFTMDIKFILLDLFSNNEENLEKILELYNECWPFFFMFAYSFNGKQDLLGQFFSRDNLTRLVYPHYPEMNYSFLESCDTRLYGRKACHLNDGSYYILHIDKPTRFSMYERQLKKVVFSFDNDQMSSDTLSCEKLADGSVNIFLPKNGFYSYEAEAASLALYDVTGKGVETLVDASLPLSGNIGGLR